MKYRSYIPQITERRTPNTSILRSFSEGGQHQTPNTKHTTKNKQISTPYHPLQSFTTPYHPLPLFTIFYPPLTTPLQPLTSLYNPLQSLTTLYHSLQYFTHPLTPHTPRLIFLIFLIDIFCTFVDIETFNLFKYGKT